ncbi:hypothetical protein P2W50_31410 [Pseudomonas protegens]|uniref:hypothetical protein n=1 Tax=Pseudomonas protegens TaxID=380021 RepID=UPI0023EC8B9A|nr:hypothetical protein [Pseudomonas protegens]MDF4211162.1 hypothetical protein [Pseudomonas protegens]
MRLADAIPLRLKVEKREMYETQAMAAEMPLSTFLRERLEREDALLEELQMLRRAFERVADRAPGNESGASGDINLNAVILEMLLILRQLGGAKSGLAQSELERQGFEIWSAER